MLFEIKRVNHSLLTKDKFTICSKMFTRINYFKIKGKFMILSLKIISNSNLKELLILHNAYKTPIKNCIKNTSFLSIRDKANTILYSIIKMTECLM